MNFASSTLRPLRKQDVISQEAGGTTVLLDMASGRYYSLNEVGRRIWDLCDGSRTVSEIVSTLSEHYNTPTETLECDVRELLAELSNEHLVGT